MISRVEQGTKLDSGLMNGIIDATNQLYTPDQASLSPYTNMPDGPLPDVLDIKQCPGQKLVNRESGQYLSTVANYLWMYVGKDVATLKSTMTLDGDVAEKVIFTDANDTSLDSELSDIMIQNYLSDYYYNGWFNTGIQGTELEYYYCVGKYGGPELSSLSNDFILVFTNALSGAAGDLSSRVKDVTNNNYVAFNIAKHGKLLETTPELQMPGQNPSSSSSPVLRAYAQYTNFKKYDFRTHYYEPWEYMPKFGGFINPTYMLGSSQLTCDSVSLSSYAGQTSSEISTLGELGISYVPAFLSTNYLVVDCQAVSAVLMDDTGISSISAAYQVPIKIATVLSSGEVAYFNRHPVIPAWEQFSR